MTYIDDPKYIITLFALTQRRAHPCQKHIVVCETNHSLISFCAYFLYFEVALHSNIIATEANMCPLQILAILFSMFFGISESQMIGNYLANIGLLLKI